MQETIPLFFSAGITIGMNKIENKTGLFEENEKCEGKCHECC